MRGPVQTFETILTLFFFINNGTAELVNIWDSFKAYIRGILKQQTALSKKKDKLQIYQKV